MTKHDSVRLNPAARRTAVSRMWRRSLLVALGVAAIGSVGLSGRAAAQRPAAAGAAARSDSGTISVNFKDTPVIDAALTLSRAAGRDVVLSKALTGKVTLSLRDKSPDEALRGLATAIDADYLRIGEVYYIAPTPELRSLAAKLGDRRVVMVHAAKPADLAGQLQARYPYLSVTAQTTPKSLLLVGRAEDIDEAAAAIKEMDDIAGRPIPVEPPAPEPVSREVVPLKNVPAEDLLASIRTIAPAVKATAVGRAVVVEGTASDMAVVRKVLETLDAPLPIPAPERTIQIYQVKYISALSAEAALRRSLPDLQVSVAPDIFAPAPGVLSPISTGSSTSGLGGSSGGGSGSGSGATGGSQGVSAGTSNQGGSGYGPRGGTNPTQGGGLTSDIERTTRLILQGDRATISRALSILDQVDLRPQQVEIESRVVEISPEDVKNVGVSWTTPGQIDIGLKSLGGFKTAVVPQSDFKFSATIDFLIQKNVAKLMANPRTVVQDSEDASIFIGDLLRYRVLREQTAFGNPVFDIESVPVGITLLVRPRVNPNGEITMKIHPAVSTPTTYIDGVPQISSREIDTTVRLKDGDTFAIGGLIRDDELRVMSKLPILGDLPLIGRLFRSDRKDRKRSEIVILIKAKLLD